MSDFTKRCETVLQRREGGDKINFGWRGSLGAGRELQFGELI